MRVEGLRTHHEDVPEETVQRIVRILDEIPTENLHDEAPALVTEFGQDAVDEALRQQTQEGAA